MIRSILVVFLVTLQAAHAAVPRLFVDKEFTPVSFAEAVNYYVGLGENRAITELEGLASTKETYLETYRKGFTLHERVGWMCRVLFEGKAGHALRPPKFGVLERLPPPIMLEKDWPKFPVAPSGSSYFVLWEGYIALEHQSEDPKEYIQYCRQNGIFRKEPVLVPTRTEALKDLAALRTSATWKRIKWTYSFNGQAVSLNEETVWNFLESQPNRIR
jgi:hypothetical protein